MASPTLLLAAGWGSLVLALGRPGLAAEGVRSRGRALAPRVRAVRTPLGARPFLRVLGARRRRRCRAEVRAAAVPVVVDLLAVAVGAGATPPRALDAIAPWVPPPLGAWCAELAGAVQRGRPFAETCARWSEDPELGPLARGLAASASSGAPLGPLLDRLAVEARAATRRRAEARARAVPVRLLFPLVVTVLPAFGLLTVAPVLLGGIGGP